MTPTPQTVEMRTATLFSNTEERFSAVPLLPANVSPFWMQKVPLVIHRLDASGPGNSFPAILEVQAFFQD